MKNDRQNQEESQTPAQSKPSKQAPDQAQARQSNNRLFKREDYLTKLTKLTPEEAALRLKKCAAIKKCREKKRAEETPEQAAERRLIDRNYRRQQYRIKRGQETPEEAAARRLKNKLYKRQYCQSKKETLEQIACQIAEEEMKKVQTQVATESKPDNFPIVKNEVNRDEFDESWSSVKDSEGCASHSIYDESTTSEYKQMHNYSDACSDQKCQLFIERVKIKSENEDPILQDGLIESDEHLEYVASIVEKLRTCNRSKSEIDFAKKLIDEILFDLVHKGVKSDQSFAPDILQNVIIKEEVDL